MESSRLMSCCAEIFKLDTSNDHLAIRQIINFIQRQRSISVQAKYESIQV